MSQTIRLTITPDIEKALQILRKSTSGTLNTTELIKLAVGELAQLKRIQLPQSLDITPEEMDKISTRSFYEWAKEDGSLNVDNIAHPDQLKPFTPKPYVRTR